MNLSFDLRAAFVHEDAGRHGCYYGAGRVGNEPAEKLMPEEIVRGIAESFTHLPPPSATGRENGGAAVTITLSDKQRHFAAANIQAGEYRGSGLGRAGIFIVGKVGKLLPSRSVFSRIVEESGDGRVHSGLSQLNGRRIAMKIVAARGQE